MTIGTNDSAVKLGARVTLESSGASIANNTVAATTASYDAVSAGSNAPDGIFALSVSLSIAPIENTTIDLYAQPLDIDGAGAGRNAPAPTATYRQKFIGSFVVKGSTGAQHLEMQASNLPRNAAYHLHNLTGQTVGSAWALSVLPATLGPI